MKQIEVELRGELPNNKNDLIQRLLAHYQSSFKSNELVIFFKYNHDFRFKIINNSAEFILKRKTIKSISNQEELITKINIEESKAFLQQLYYLGYEEGLISISKRIIFRNLESEFCLKLDTPIGDFFEIEKVISNNESIQKTEEYLKNLLNKFGLYSWNENEYNAIRSKSLVSMVKEKLISNNELNPKISLFIDNQKIYLDN
ncbi:MAG: hypothetical protein IPK88_16840 [Saprospiraceae bacterium]|nr:hypothetical protein [Candidatus Defluviibacterium haderslevense]